MKQFFTASGDVRPHPTSAASMVEDTGRSTSNAEAALCAVDAYLLGTGVVWDAPWMGIFGEAGRDVCGQGQGWEDIRGCTLQDQGKCTQNPTPFHRRPAPPDKGPWQGLLQFMKKLLN